MSSHNRNQINRLEKEIARLQKDFAAEAKKVSDLTSKENRANEAINRTKSQSTKNSKLREIERYQKDQAASRKKQADISEKLARKSEELRRYQDRQNREDEKARKKIADEQRRLMREREIYERNLSSEMYNRKILRSNTAKENLVVKEYDFFISHASEDKEDIVESLAMLLRDKGAVVWYDNFVLEIGDNLRREIEQGLINSKFGIVICSEYFFSKDWPQRELDALFTLENPNDKSILPIWHNISKDKVETYSPILANIIALNTSILSVEEITDRLMKLLNN